MRLVEKQVLFSELVARFIWELRDIGYHVTMGECWRDPRWAAQLAKTGSGINHSLHCYRLAVDLNLVYEGKFLTTKEEYEPAGELWESYAGGEVVTCWGGRFHEPDSDHFSVFHDGIK